MAKQREDLVHGPGGTFWYVSEDGETIERCRHNRPGWCGTYEWHAKDIGPDKLVLMLHEAYLEGMEDAKLEIRRVLGAA